MYYSMSRQLYYIRYIFNATFKTYKGNVRLLNTDKQLEMPPYQHIPSVYTGPSYDNVKAAYESNISPSYKMYYKKPLLLYEGKNQWVWGHDGKRYLDMFGGIVTVSTGHCHPKIVTAISDQVKKLGHVSGLYMHPSLYEYTEKLAAKLPEKLRVIYLVNSGSEANELAYLMARLYTGEQNIISLNNCYHGGTYGTSATTALSTWKYAISQPPGHIHVCNPGLQKYLPCNSKCKDCSVPGVKGTCSCSNDECVLLTKYLDEFEDTFRYSLPKKGGVAAFIAESIQGIGGVIQYPRLFLEKVYEIVHENGGLCIADEVQTGFGRTGDHFWGFQSHGIQPDIVTMAKGIGNGIPLGAVATTIDIANCLKRALHFNTFSGNPIICAGGSAVLDIIENEGMQKNALITGTYLCQQLSTLTHDFSDIVSDVRGKGFMIGVELAKNSRTKKYIKEEHMRDIFEDIKDMGVLVGKGGLFANVLRITPPMCVTKEDADFTVNVIRKALQRYRKKYLYEEEM
ncbi:alanine--glyoxylate aminotransferase 2 homolog 1, mitochondrial [Polistes fuscatus]|uniref:alanine--glyoxylate aminotransferase 2 homolog 1, mitochondrial n=1 Tax=Polistes fuscatus TaxID=30207 RepID=UPI001CA9269B|nr:alanine--glyoxylate aminotransferase 2 homolog 1, mitochondrial [Polistes fuscatus]